MGKFDGILMCTDLDGTLLKDDKSISKENLDAIEYFKSQGGLFTFITGRMPFFSNEAYDTINPNCPFGCINGGGIYDHRKMEYLWTVPISRDALKLTQYADEHIEGIGIQVNTFENIYFSKINEAMVWFRKVTHLPNLVRHYNDVTEPIAKIVFADMDDEKIKRLEECLLGHPDAEKFDYIRSEARLFEILPKGVNKGSALTKLAEISNISIDKTIAIGDYDNDVAMLKTAGTGVAVANATDEAKAVADRITVSNEEHAIAKIINELDVGELILREGE